MTPNTTSGRTGGVVAKTSEYKGCRDLRFVAIHRGGLLDETRHRLLASWAADCAEHVLPLFTARHPEDDRPRQAIETAHAWSRGEASVDKARKAAIAAHAAARSTADAAAREAARSAGHAVATAHMADHELGAAAYAIKAVRLSSPAAAATLAGERECQWQREHLPEPIRELVISDEKQRNQKFWSVFTLAVFIINFICILSISAGKCHGQSERNTEKADVFVIGGIHQDHESALIYTYERMGEIYRKLHPDLLCVEVLHKYIEDGSFKGMPFDFSKFMVPLARKDGIPIFGIDWWDEVKGNQWMQLQQKIASDQSLVPEVKLLGGIFQLLNDYFKTRDFREIHSQAMTNLWASRKELLFSIVQQHPEYRPIMDFELERNEQMTKNILRVVREHSGKRVIIAVGIDHKWYIEKVLREKGLHVPDVEQVINERWNE
jgi:hypothetical protein